MTWRDYLRYQYPEGDAWTFHGWVIEWLHGDDRPQCVRVLCWGWTSKSALRMTSEIQVTYHKSAGPPLELPESKPGLTTFIWDEQ